MGESQTKCYFDQKNLLAKVRNVKYYQCLNNWTIYHTINCLQALTFQNFSSLYSCAVNMSNVLLPVTQMVSQTDMRIVGRTGSALL